MVSQETRPAFQAETTHRGTLTLDSLVPILRKEARSWQASPPIVRHYTSPERGFTPCRMWRFTAAYRPCFQVGVMIFLPRDPIVVLAVTTQE